MIYLPAFYKQCSKCNQWFPSTTNYFYRTSRHHLKATCKKCESKRSSKFHKKNPERAKLARNNWYYKNREHSHAKTNEWKKANSKRVAEYKKEWLKNHPEIKRQINQRRRHRRKAREQSLPNTFTRTDQIRALNYFNGCCAYCGNPPSLFDTTLCLHQDHFIPVTKGGGYTPYNILPACQSCNLSKRDQDPFTWILNKFGTQKARKIISRIKTYFQFISSLQLPIEQDR